MSNLYPNGTRIDPNSCVAPIPGIVGSYGYNPSEAAGITFCALFGVSMVLHLYTTIRYRVWWQSVFAIGALTELIGWGGRLWSSECPYQDNPFLMQITTLIIAPAFFTAGIYIILGRLIFTLGADVSPISPRTYLYIFCTADVISLIIQAVGGAMASTAFQEMPPGDTKNGTDIMVGGIVFQMAAIAVFSVLFCWVMVRALKSRSEMLRQRNILMIAIATVMSIVLIVVRSVYRTIELLQGWEGYLITTEVFFIVLDGAMMVLAVAVFNVAQPRWANREEGPREEYVMSDMDVMTLREDESASKV